MLSGVVVVALSLGCIQIKLLLGLITKFRNFETGFIL